MRGVLTLMVLSMLAACGGGGGSGGAGSTSNPPPTNAPQPPPPGGSASPAPTQSASPAPSGAPTASASPGTTMLPDTTGRVGLFQEFDRLMTPAQIQSDAPRYDFVWAAQFPQIWQSANPRIITSRYFIPQEDRSQLSGHDLNWWQTNHPDWILYACDSPGHLTHDYAYWGGVSRPDVPLDFHNPGVIDYQVRQLNGANAIATGDRALAIDQITFQDTMVGGNPNFGQSVKPGEFACGVWHGTTPVIRYSGVNDPAWTADMINFVKTARQIVTQDPTLAPYHLKILVNHTRGSLRNSDEQTLLSLIDGFVDERGYADYGRYANADHAPYFNATTQYLIAVQKRGIAAFSINYFKDAAVTPAQREYALAAYFMANEGGLDIFITPSVGGSEENYPEYSVRLGRPCEEYNGGPYVYYRRYSGGLVVLNSGSLPSAFENAALPANHTYTDIDGRPVSNPLRVNSNDGYVLTTTNGCS